MQAPVIFHIGFPKTATTLLQNNFFPNLDEVTFFNRDEDLREIGIYDLIFSGDQSYDPQKLKKVIQEKKKQRKPIIISHEGMIGNIFKGGVNFQVISKRIFEIEPQAKILITIREQTSIIESLYRQYIQQGGTLNFKRFLFSRNNDIVYFDPMFLKYDLLIKHYADLFGQKNILVLPLELLKNDKHTFFEELFNFLQIPPKTGSFLTKEKENIGHPYFSLQFLRFTNHFIYSWNNPGAFISKRIISVWKMRSFLKNFLDPCFFRIFFPEKKFWDTNEKIDWQKKFAESNKELKKMGIKGLNSYPS